MFARRATRIGCTVLLTLCVLSGGLSSQSDFAHARAGYAKWLKHGNAYRVDGSFGPYKHSFTARIAWKGNGFVIHTPLGTHRLKRQGDAVTFKAYFDKAWAFVTWRRTRAVVVYKGQKGSARVQKITPAQRKASPRRIQNFNRK